MFNWNIKFLTNFRNSGFRERLSTEFFSYFFDISG